MALTKKWNAYRVACDEEKVLVQTLFKPSSSSTKQKKMHIYSAEEHGRIGAQFRHPFSGRKEWMDMRMTGLAEE
ncbi:hypothetical protein SUGI_0397440 [Cryptomeria japonica]|nr:hypothetical protein SUGI_0397440 [Cryptomeria japonica]